MTTQIRGLTALIQMLQTRRPARSKSERKWIAKWLTPLGLERDEYGNLIKRIGESRVLWSSHTDTVHKMGGLQRLAITERREILLHPDERESNCLGADCTTGVWLMREMILEGKPGLYVFHRDEEIGGLGSSFIAKKTPELLKGIDYAIAFDRYGKTSVITHQLGRCCSDTFGTALAEALGAGFDLDTTGVFTDTANYSDLVPECTNLSVGYFNHHRDTEWQDGDFAMSLRDRMLALNADDLPVSREPGEDDEWTGSYYDPYYGTRAASNSNSSSFGTSKWGDDPVNFGSASYDMVKLCRAYPEEVADYLVHLGVSEDILRNVIDSYYTPTSKVS